MRESPVRIFAETSSENMAERVGFEPTVDLRPQRLSRPPD